MKSTKYAGKLIRLWSDPLNLTFRTQNGHNSIEFLAILRANGLILVTFLLQCCSIVLALEFSLCFISVFNPVVCYFYPLVG